MAKRGGYQGGSTIIRVYPSTKVKPRAKRIGLLDVELADKENKVYYTTTVVTAEQKAALAAEQLFRRNETMKKILSRKAKIDAQDKSKRPK